MFNSTNPLNGFREQNRQELVSIINNEINACSKCNNNFCHKNYIGDIDAKVIIINDNATNDNEIIEYFNDLLQISDLNIDDVIQIFAVACVTVRKDKNDFVQRLPSKKECNNCKQYLTEIIDAVKPKIIISLGATALNQFIPDSNILDYVETKQIFNGIPTLINFSVKDLFNLCQYKTDEEIDKISESILKTLNTAAQYLKGD